MSARLAAAVGLAAVLGHPIPAAASWGLDHVGQSDSGNGRFSWAVDGMDDVTKSERPAVASTRPGGPGLRCDTASAGNTSDTASPTYSGTCVVCPHADLLPDDQSETTLQESEQADQKLTAIGSVARVAAGSAALQRVSDPVGGIGGDVAQPVLDTFHALVDTHLAGGTLVVFSKLIFSGQVCDTSPTSSRRPTSSLISSSAARTMLTVGVFASRISTAMAGPVAGVGCVAATWASWGVCCAACTGTNAVIVACILACNSWKDFTLTVVCGVAATSPIP